MTHGLAVLSGPISGIEDGNREAFDQAKNWLEREGWEVWSPRHHVLSDRCFEESQRLGKHHAEGEYYRRLMRACYAAILEANVLFVLPGWLKSGGAQREVLLAMSIGLKIQRLDMRGHGVNAVLGYPTIVERFKPVELLFADTMVDEGHAAA